MLIDDDPIANYLHYNLIESLQIAKKIDIVTNGEEALSFISKNHYPEIIFLDIHMPVMDGIVFLQTFRNLFRAPKTKIYVLSSSDHHKDVDSCKQWNIDGYLIKPLSDHNLKQLFHSITTPDVKKKDLQV